jgi:hypothetical protein
MNEFNADWRRRGGTIVDDNRGHVVYKFPGVPAGAVHAPRSTGTARVPRHLISRLQRIQRGQVQAPRPEPLVAVASEVSMERPRIPVRPNLPRPESSIVPPITPEILTQARREIEHQKATDRARMLALPKGPSFIEQPYRPSNPLEWIATDFVEIYDRHSYEKRPELSRAFNQAQTDGTFREYDSVTEHLEALNLLQMLLTPGPYQNAVRIINRRPGVPLVFAIVKSTEFRGLLAGHTYVNEGEESIQIVTTVTPGEFARFCISWERGVDCLRAECRSRGIAR